MSSSSRQRENEKNDRRRSRSRTPVRGRMDSRQQSPNRRHERVPSTHRFRTSAGEQTINSSGKKVFDVEKLKEIKVTIRENDAHINGTPPPIQRIHRNIENPEQLFIYRREGEGSRPIFASVVVNSTPEVNEDCTADGRKRPSDRSYARHSRSPHPAERPSIRGDDSYRDNRKSPIAGPSYKRSISSSSKSPNAKRKRSRSRSRCSDHRKDDSYNRVTKSPVASCSFRRSRSCSLAPDRRKRVSAERSPARRPPADHKRDVTPRTSGHRINFSERRSSASSPRPHTSENLSYQRSGSSKRSSPRRVTPPRHRTPPSTANHFSRRNVTDSSRHVSPHRRSSPERRASQRRENSPRHRSPSNRHSPRYDRERERDRDYERDRNRDRRHSVERNRSDRYRRSSPEHRSDRRHSSERGRSDRDRHRSPSSRRARSPLHGGSTDPRRMPDVVPIPPYDPFYEFPGARYWIPGIPPGLAARGMVPGPYRFPPRMLPHPAGVFYQPMRPRMPFTPRSPMVRPPRPAITK